MSAGRRTLVMALVVTAACGQREPPEVPIPSTSPPARPAPAPPPARGPDVLHRQVGAPFTGGPDIRIGLLVDVTRGTIGGGTALVIRPTGGRGSYIVAAGRTATLSTTGSLISVDAGDALRALTPPLVIEPGAADGFVRVAGKDYRGVVEVRRGTGGLVFVDRLSMESYLGGVVAAELGVNDPDVAQALQAQAVIARTYAVRNLGRNRRGGFDLLATVADQKYDGVNGETSAAWLALAATAGEIVTYQGAPIDAFFHSTCGGRTAAGSEVFPNADRPYLRSVSDLDPSGQAYCRESPRFQWSESWDSGALAAALSRGLHLSDQEAGSVRSVEATARSASGRVTKLRVRLRGRDVVIDGSNAVRRALPPADLDLLRSATFTLTYRGDGDRIGRLELQGTGSGHGVGLCQWGAVGRARAGARYNDILSAYYPGTRIEHRW